MSTRTPDDPSDDTPDEVVASVPDTRPDGASAAQPHDTLFRQIFGDPAQAAVVLRSILPPRVVAHIDWDTPLEPVHASMVGQGAEQHHGDLLYKIKLVDGRGAFVWVLFEHYRMSRAIPRTWRKCHGPNRPRGLRVRQGAQRSGSGWQVPRDYRRLPALARWAHELPTQR
jgi:hypothetical protein